MFRLWSKKIWSAKKYFARPKLYNLSRTLWCTVDIVISWWPNLAMNHVQHCQRLSGICFRAFSLEYGEAKSGKATASGSLPGPKQVASGLSSPPHKTLVIALVFSSSYWLWLGFIWGWFFFWPNSLIFTPELAFRRTSYGKEVLLMNFPSSEPPALWLSPSLYKLMFPSVPLRPLPCPQASSLVFFSHARVPSLEFWTPKFSETYCLLWVHKATQPGEYGYGKKLFLWKLTLL